MDKRLQKRHKRQVARAKERVRQSEPDLRTPEQIKAAREASRPVKARETVFSRSTAPSAGSGRAHTTGGAAKTDA